MIRQGVSLGLSAALTRATAGALRAKAPGGRERWERRNYAGRKVELYAGPASALAVAVGAGRVSPAAGVAVAVAGICGAYDDIAGADDARRGFRAHLRACGTAKSPAGPSSCSGSRPPGSSRARS